MAELRLTIGRGMAAALKECADLCGLPIGEFVSEYALGYYLEAVGYHPCRLCQRFVRDIPYVCPECEAVLATVKDADDVARLVREYEERDMATGSHE